MARRLYGRWLAFLVVSFAAALPAAAAGGSAHGIDVRVAAGGWGEVAVADIATALYAVADELVSVMPAGTSVPIVVSHTRGNPVALYERGPQGEYRVRLHASGSSWALYVYEFAHELCHVLSNHDEHAATARKRHNQWFEETLCETASLYALTAVAKTWELAPPAPVWTQRASRLRRFADRLLAEETRRLPPGTTLAAWLAAHEDSLRADPYLRQKNDLVAKLLLPLFEEDPARWRALAYLNLHAADPTAALPDYLAHWNEKAPAHYRGFIGKVRTLLAREESGVAQPASGTLLADAPVAVPGASAGPVRERASDQATAATPGG